MFWNWKECERKRKVCEKDILVLLFAQREKLLATYILCFLAKNTYNIDTSHHVESLHLHPLVFGVGLPPT